MKRYLVGLGLAVAALLLQPMAADAIIVGTNPDVHFDFEGMCANDFHIEGLIHSAMGTVPTVVEIFVNGPPETGHWRVLRYTVYQPDPYGRPDDWWFEADFITDKKICFCQSIHFGIKFDVTCYNVIIDLHGWWTLDGVRIFPPKSFKNETDIYDSDVAVTGFHVDDIGRIRPGKQTLRIENNTDVMIEVPIIEVALGTEEVPLAWMNAEYLGGAGSGASPHKSYNNLEWINVPIPNPLLEPGQHFDVALEEIGVHITPGTFFHIRGINDGDASAPAGVLNVHEKKEGKETWSFFWEQHEAHY
jgi:hypothetical protein